MTAKLLGGPRDGIQMEVPDGTRVIKVGLPELGEYPLVKVDYKASKEAGVFLYNEQPHLDLSKSD